MANKYLLYLIIASITLTFASAYISHKKILVLDCKIENLKKDLVILSNLLNYKPKDSKDKVESIDNTIDNDTKKKVTVKKDDDIKESFSEKQNKEVIKLQNEIANIEGLIDTSSNESEYIQGNQTNHIKTVLEKDEYKKKILSETKSAEPVTSEILNKVELLEKNHNSSEYDDLDNVNAEHNSELNQLIQKESELPEINENDINNNFLQESSSMNKLSDVFNNTEIKKDTISTNNLLNDIEYNVIMKNFSTKELKKLCRDNDLIVAGNKKNLINRLVDNNLKHLLKEESNLLNISSN